MDAVVLFARLLCHAIRVSSAFPSSVKFQTGEEEKGGARRGSGGAGATRKDPPRDSRRRGGGDPFGDLDHAGAGGRGGNPNDKQHYIYIYIYGIGQFSLNCAVGLSVCFLKG